MSSGGPLVTSSASPYWVEEHLDGHGHARFRAKIGGLHCSLCTGTIERALGRRDGVEKVAVSLTHEQALVDYDPAKVRPEDLLATLRDIGYTIWDPRKVRPFEEEEAELVREGKRLLTAIVFSVVTISLLVHTTGVWSLVVPAVVGSTFLGIAFLVLRAWGLRTALLGTVGLGALVVVVLALNAAAIARGAVPWVIGVFAVAVVFGLARHILAMALQSLRRRILNQHVMLEAGAFAGLAGGVIGLAPRPTGYPTAAFFAVSVLLVNYHVFSEWLSLLVKTRSSQSVKRLLDLQPDTARIVRDGESELPIAEVVIGDLARVRPGERVPVDGEVVAGRSAVDQSLVTGEPLPVDRAEGDRVIGGSINGTGTLLVEVTAIGEGSFLAQVIRHVEDARALKPGILHLVDRILRVYAPLVLSLSALSLIAWLLGSWAVTGQPDVQRAVFAALSVLVMGYPCAVGIAAPLSIVRGAGTAADEGIIMRTGEAFQAFRSVRQIVLDKTGTLTEGRPIVRELEALTDPDELLSLAAAAEAASEHPLGQAVLSAALDRGLPVPEVEDFESVTGQGVSALIDGSRILVGRPSYLELGGIDASRVRGRVAQLESLGRTVIAVSRDDRLLGVIALGDTLRADAAQMIAAMHKTGLIPVLVTGDNRRAAERVGRELGIEQVHAEILPGEKAQIVRTLQRSGRVAMVGDGINDAPALMQAEVGLAMGAGTDIAIESADIIVVSNRLTAILRAREISRSSYRKTKQNVFLAFLFNGIGIPVAATGLVYPVWAMVAMATSVTTIFINSLWGQPRLFVNAVLSVGARKREHPAAGERVGGAA